MFRILWDILRWYETPVDINVEKEKKYLKSQWYSNSYHIGGEFLAYSSTLLGNTFGKGNKNKFILNFIVYFVKSYVITWRLPIPP